MVSQGQADVDRGERERERERERKKRSIEWSQAVLRMYSNLMFFVCSGQTEARLKRKKRESERKGEAVLPHPYTPHPNQRHFVFYFFLFN